MDDMIDPDSYLAQIIVVRAEVASAANWCAQRHLQGHVGDPLPENISVGASRRIGADIIGFQAAVRTARDAIRKAEGE